ncbi:MAG: hypothetical protein ACOX6T_12315 [Myxococcales bacterium]|jgi:hypothetical protein
MPLSTRTVALSATADATFARKEALSATADATFARKEASSATADATFDVQGGIVGHC